MNRRQVICTAILLALIGAILPLGLAFYIAWTRTVAQEQRDLEATAHSGLQHAQEVLAQIEDTLRYFQTLAVKPCSQEHIQQMRAATISTREVDEIGYFRNLALKCSSWGRIQERIELPAPDMVLGNGVELRLNTFPMASPNTRMIDIFYRSHNVLSDPVRFVDIELDSSMQIAVLTANGKLISSRHGPSPEVVQKVLSGVQPAMDREVLSVVARGQDFSVVVTEPRSKIVEKLRREQMLLLPMGLLLALIIVGLVVWFSRRRLSMVGELGIAIERKEFSVHYQPILELQTGRCIGAEALIRWRRPDGRMVRPDLFIAIAEEHKMISQITEQVFRIVIRELRDMLVADRDLHIAVNLSAQDMQNGRALKALHRMLAGTGIEPGQIWLEATERGFMDVDTARATIGTAREMGHAIAIDDFGTGYSSLSYLQQLPLDALKIDKSFVDTIGTDSATSSVTPHIIDMARSLNLLIVAEGIESEAQAQYLKDKGVHFGQGWLYAKAMPVGEFLSFYEVNLRESGAPFPQVLKEL